LFDDDVVVVGAAASPTSNAALPADVATMYEVVVCRLLCRLMGACIGFRRCSKPSCLRLLKL
jgi:hypothetical protein